MNPAASQTSCGDPGAPAIREQLQRLLASPGFQANLRASAFLRHVVEQTLLGRTAGIKEATIGVEVFCREPSYDTKIDPIVRSVARVVREKLNAYYAAASGDLVRIELPKGSYIPVFRLVLPAKEPDGEGHLPLAPAAYRMRPWPVLAFGALLLAAVALRGSFVHPAETGSAALWYRLGRAKLMRGDCPGARAPLEAAVRLAPGDALAHAMLADDLRLLGYNSLALAEARTAEAGIRGLSTTGQLEVEASFRQASGDYPGAVDALAQLRKLHPERMEYALAMARALADNADYPGCLSALSTARGPDAQLNLLEATCLAGTGDFQAALEPVRKAAKAARRSGIKEIYARARLLEAGLLMSTGHGAESRPVREDARRVCKSIGDAVCVVRALRVQANFDLWTVSAATALREYQSALPLARDLGSNGEIVNLLTGEGVARELIDDLDGANTALVDAQLNAQKGGLPVSGPRLNLAELAIAQGHLARALMLAGEASAGAVMAGDKNSDAAAHLLQAKVLLLEGDLPGAGGRLDDVVRTSRETHLPNVDVVLCTLQNASLNRIAGRLDLATSQLQQAKAISEAATDIDVATEEVELLLAQRRFGDAQASALAALRTLRNTGRVGETARLSALLSDAYGCSGRLEEARAAARAAWSRVSVRSAPLVRITALISSGRWSENEAEAERYLEEAVDSARILGFRPVEDLGRRLLLQRRLDRSRAVAFRADFPLQLFTDHPIEIPHHGR